MVYRQAVKQETAKQGENSADCGDESRKSFDESVPSFSVGNKKLIIPSSSSTSTAGVARAETKPKLLLLDPIGMERKKSDKTVGDDNNNNEESVCTADSAAGAGGIDVSEIAGSVDDLKLNSLDTAASGECCSNVKLADVESEIVEIDAERHADDTVTQTRKGRKAAKKPAATGARKGSHFIIGSRPSDHYFRSVCLSVCLFVCLFVQSFSQPSSIRFGSN